MKQVRFLLFLIAVRSDCYAIRTIASIRYKQLLGLVISVIMKLGYKSLTSQPRTEIAIINKSFFKGFKVNY